MDVVQELVVLLIIAAAVGYLAWQRVRRKASGNCCGKAECPAAKHTLSKLR